MYKMQETVGGRGGGRTSAIGIIICICWSHLAISVQLFQEQLFQGCNSMGLFFFQLRVIYLCCTQIWCPSFCCWKSLHTLPKNKLWSQRVAREEIHFTETKLQNVMLQNLWIFLMPLFWVFSIWVSAQLIITLYITQAPQSRPDLPLSLGDLWSLNALMKFQVCSYLC